MPSTTINTNSSQSITATAPESPSELPCVGIVVVTHNLKDILRETLESIRQLDYPNLKVAIVDNASQDGTPEMIRSDFSEFHLIYNETGQGFARAINQGSHWLAKEHHCKYFFLNSNDITFAGNIVSEYVQKMESDPSIAILGAKVYFADPSDMIWHAGAHMDPWTGHCGHIGIEKTDRGQFDEEMDCDYVTGCGYFVRGSFFESTGFLEEKLVFYFEDADLCYRAREAGHRVVYYPKAKLWHKTSTTLAKSRSTQLRYATRNALYLLEKRRAGKYPWTLWAFLLITLPLKALVFLVLGQWKNPRGLWQGTRDWKNGEFGMISN